MGKWEMVQWGQVLQIKNGKNQKAVESSSGAYPIYGSGGVMGYANDYICPEKTIIIGRKGSINSPIYVEQKFWNVDTAFGLVANPNLDSKFLYYFCVQYNFQRHNRTVTIPSLTKSDLLQISMPIPPLDEQKRIAKNLDLASEIVKGYKEQLAELDKLVQSVFYEMFGDPVTNEKGWAIEPLSKTARIVTGNTPPRSCKDNYGYHVEWIKTDNITDALYVTQASEYLSERGAAIGRLVDADAILMACIAGSIKSIGRVAIANRVVAFNQQINAVIANKYDILFLYWLFKMTQGYIQSTINMSLKGILSKGKLEKLAFIVPPHPLQTRFASIVTEIEAQKAQVQQALTEAENLFNSLMQEYFE